MGAFEFTAVAMILVFLIISMIWRFNEKKDKLKREIDKLKAENDYLKTKINK